ncbi:DegT/DnrJ/EryC1/StrS family aminotransferase [Chromobacterium violaceum]|uniref:DegT/DnrJ/EryC1/StrS family aminotransferase n=1 Tax=Chromobacterium violaceum TaxID=536 RepID=UPI0018B08CD0|nr:DegT/DnrJ/EryC1/StrS family aminotransferase [Chromobacterium violaceum]
MEILPNMFGQAGNLSVWPDFGKPHVLRCDTGRSALKLALQCWAGRVRRNFTVWLPHYVCHSVVQAVRQAGHSLAYYGHRPSEQVFSPPPTPQSGDFVVLVHYFGLRNAAALDWQAAQTTRDFAILEDCVQSPYTAGVGRLADFAISSLRKWWPTPDGATLASTHDLDGLDLAASDEAFISQRMAAKQLRAHGIGEERYLQWIDESESRLDDVVPRQASWLSASLLGTVDIDAAMAARRENWFALEEGLAGIGGVAPLFSDLAIDEIPLAYPIVVSTTYRQKLRVALRDRRVFCPVHWILESDAPEEDALLSASILSIPLDQRYVPADMRKVACMIGKFMAEELN